MLAFEEVKKRIVEELAGRLFTNYYTGVEYFPSNLTIDDVNIPLLAPEEREALLFKYWYGRTLSQKLSGDVTVKVLPQYLFTNTLSDELYCVFITRKYSRADIPPEVEGEGYYIKRHHSRADVYVGAVKINPSDVITIRMLGAEGDLVLATLAASRLAKSLSRTLVPIIDLENGELVDYQPVGFEELLFIEFLRFFLYRERVERRA
jgi:hypothetical protein